jgi:hypothetical protein
MAECTSHAACAFARRPLEARLGSKESRDGFQDGDCGFAERGQINLV